MAKFQTAQCWILRILVFLLPLFFLPYFSDFFDFAKLTLLVVGALVGLFVWALSASGGARIRVTPFDLPVLGFAVVVSASGFFTGANKLDSFVFAGTASVIAASSLLYFLLVQQEKDKHSFVSWLFFGAAFAGFVAFLAGAGALQFSTLPAWARAATFTTVGGSLAAVALFAALLPSSIGKLLEERRIYTKFILNLLVVLGLVVGLLAQGYHILPGKPNAPKILPVSTGWSIAVETLKKQPLLGVGPGNFLEAFGKFRPVEYNASDVWNLRFAASSNWYLHVFTTVGLLGFAALLWILWSLLAAAKAGKREYGRFGHIHYGLAGILVVFLLLPPSFMLIVSFYIFLAALATVLGKDLHFHLENVSSGILVLAAGLLLVAAIYFGLPTVRAEVAYKKALDAVARNDGLATYNWLRDAIGLNPQATHYRITNSQVNLALANSVATNATARAASSAEAEDARTAEAKQAQISEQDRNTISQLVQQSIGEAKAAVALNRQLSTTWANLAQIYRSITGIAQGADQFAIAAYQQAIALEPTNPNLRIELGGIFYALKQYDEAVRAFELAVAAKPDLANAHYNLAIALRDAGKTTRAAAEMRQTLALIAPGARDWDTVRGQLEELEKKLAAEATPSAVPQQAGVEQPASPDASQGGPPLQAPQPAPSPVVEPPLDLPEGAAPPSN